MSSYFPSFNYLGINSREQGLVVVHFDADQGEVDTFLGMEPVYSENAYGSRRLDYGAKYNNVANFRITMIKPDGNDLSVAEVRKHLRWLTGAKQNSPLELTKHFIEEFISDGAKVFKLTNTCDHVFQVYVDNTLLATDKWSYDKTTNSITFTSAQIRGSTIKISYNQIKCYFIGRITNAWQYKMDSRTVGLIFEFTSISPWAYSSKQVTSAFVGDGTEVIVNNDTDDLYGYTCANVIFNSVKNNMLKNTYTLKTVNFSMDNSSNVGSTIPRGMCDEDEYNGFHVVCNNANLRWWPGSPQIVPGRSYTMSIQYKINSGSAPIQFQYIFRDASNATVSYYDSTSLGVATVYEKDGWMVLVSTFTVPNNSSITNVNVAVRTGSDNTAYTCDYNVRRPKLEQGNKATIWTPHVDDPGFDSLQITNNNTNETTLITNIAVNETITMSDNMMITSDNSSKIFGNTFNFVFPRLAAGENNFIVTGYGNLTFEYVYAIKIGDCAMDIIEELN